MRHTEFATMYAITRRRAAGRRSLTWDDVANAYDAGLRHALALPPSQQNQLSRVIRVMLAANKEVIKS